MAAPRLVSGCQHPKMAGHLLDPIAGRDDLVQSRPLVVVLRLLVDAKGELMQGELVDMHQISRGRFAGWDGLAPAVRSFLNEERASPVHGDAVLGN